MDSQQIQRSKSTQPNAANMTLQYPKQQLDRLVSMMGTNEQLQSVASSYQSHDRILLPVIGGLGDPKDSTLPGYSTRNDIGQPPIIEENPIEHSQATGSDHAEATKVLRKSVEGGVKAVKEHDGQITIQIDDVAVDAIQRMTTTSKQAGSNALASIAEHANTPYTNDHKRSTFSTQKRQSLDFTAASKRDGNHDETVIGDVIAEKLTSEEFAIMP